MYSIVNVEDGIGIGMSMSQNNDVLLCTSGLIMCVALVLQANDQIYLAHIVPGNIGAIENSFKAMRTAAGQDNANMGIRLFVNDNRAYSDNHLRSVESELATMGINHYSVDILGSSTIYVRVIDGRVFNYMSNEDVSRNIHLDEMKFSMRNTLMNLSHSVRGSEEFYNEQDGVERSITLKLTAGLLAGEFGIQDAWVADTD